MHVLFFFFVQRAYICLRPIICNFCMIFMWKKKYSNKKWRTLCVRFVKVANRCFLYIAPVIIAHDYLIPSKKKTPTVNNDRRRETHIIYIHFKSSEKCSLPTTSRLAIAGSLSLSVARRVSTRPLFPCDCSSFLSVCKSSSDFPSSSSSSSSTSIRY